MNEPHAPQTGHDPHAAPGAGAHAHDHGAELKFYMKIFWALMGLTALTIGAAYLGDLIPGFPEALTLLIAMVIAATKGTLVVLYFMHLKMETKNIYVIAGVPLALAILLLIALGPDVAGFGR
jgi:cytochrome c oxidase subunit 4